MSIRHSPSTFTVFIIATLVTVSFIITARGQSGSTRPAAASSARVTKVACVGDSITFGSGIKDRVTGSYPSQLAVLLGERWVVRNFGVSGATLLRAGDRPYHRQVAFAQALEYEPDVVAIMLGTNDSKPQNWSHQDEFVADYKVLVGAFRAANPEARFFICLPVPAFPGNFGIREEIIGPEVLPLVRQVAAETGAMLIDLHGALEGQGKFFPDKIHPNADGAALIAKAVHKALSQSPSAPGAATSQPAAP